MLSKAVSESAAEFQHLVLPPDINAMGTIFGGRIMEWIDKGAAIVAMRHCRCIAVTASMDALNFYSPVYLGDIVVLKVSINFVHRSSMEIGVRVEAENPKTGLRRHTSSAYLTFVALDDNQKPTSIPELVLNTPEARRRFEEGKKRREVRLQLKAESKN